MAADAPVPSITSASHNLIDAGGPYFLITVDGSGFVSGSVVKWAGTSLNRIFLSSTQIKAAITPELRVLEREFALILCRLEGLEVSDTTRAIFQRYVNGELTIKELGAAIDQYLHCPKFP